MASQLRAQFTKSSEASGQHKLLSETGIPQLRNTSKRVGGGGVAPCRLALKLEKYLKQNLTLVKKFESSFKCDILELFHPATFLECAPSSDASTLSFRGVRSAFHSISFCGEQGIRESEIDVIALWILSNPMGAFLQRHSVSEEGDNLEQAFHRGG